MAASLSQCKFCDMAFHIELSKRAFILLLILAVVALGAVLLFVYLPSAQISVYPAQENRTVQQEITLSTSATEPDFVRFVLPARLVEKELQDSLSITRSEVEATEDFARGTITLINEQNEEQPLLPKSHVRHEESGVQFLTDNAVRIPPQSEIQVGVTAKEKGSIGNVSPGKFVVEKLPESLQVVVYGESRETFSGGLTSGSAITETEISTAQDRLSKELTQQALAELTLEAGGTPILPELLHIEPLEDSASVEPGSTAVSFEVRRKVRARAIIVDQNDLLSLTLLALRESSNGEEEFVEYDPSSFSTSIARADFERGQVRVSGTLDGIFAKKIEPSVLGAQDVIGLGEQETKEYFENFSSIGEVEVEFSPFWVQSIPSRPSATEIVVKSETN